MKTYLKRKIQHHLTFPTLWHQRSWHATQVLVLCLVVCLLPHAHACLRVKGKILCSEGLEGLYPLPIRLVHTPVERDRLPDPRGATVEKHARESVALVKLTQPQ